VSFLSAQKTLTLAVQLVGAGTKETLPVRQLALHSFAEKFSWLAGLPITDIDGDFNSRIAFTGKY